MVLDIFEQIIFGNGAWIGFIVLALMSFVGITIYKWFGVITIVLFTLLGLKYLELYNAGSSNLTWFWVFAWVCAVMQVFYMIKRKE
jgi:hypothetical protein